MCSQHSSPATPNGSDAGFTISEATIALALTLVVITGAVETLTRTSTLVGTSRVISETNHGLQAAMSMMSRDLIQAGQGIPLGGVPIPTGGGATAIVRPGPTAGLAFPVAMTMPSLTPGSNLGPTLLGVQTDMVTILYADRTLNLDQFPLDAIAADGSTMTVNAGTNILGANGIRAGDIILFTNPLGNAMQFVTADPVDQNVLFNAIDPLGLNQRAAPNGTILDLQVAAGVYPPTTAIRIFMVSYYVDTATDPTLPRLARRVNNGPPLAIAMGIENLQLSYDLVDGVTNPTNVNTPPVGNSPDQIRKANLFLAARSQDVNPQTRQFFRNSRATQVALRSLSFMDLYF